jgi:CRISPR-associated protein Csd2
MSNLELIKSISDPNKRYDFLLLYDVQDGNPNGDPDAGNLPRIDPETMHGIVTDVCLKRKIRNYVDMIHQSKYDALDTDGGCGIFVRDSGVLLNDKLESSAVAHGMKAKEKDRKKTVSARHEMCARYYDVRLFGGVLSTGDYNCGQVRGPMQLTFSRSVDPILPQEFTVTRMAVTNEKDESKGSTMGRKALIPYGLYLGKGFYSPMLAKDTGVTKEDLELFWTALLGMFENDRSASRGYMQLQGVKVFVHDNPLGNAPSGKLFSRLNAVKNTPTPRDFTHYDVSLNMDNVPEGVTIVELL